MDDARDKANVAQGTARGVDPWERDIDWQLLIAFNHSNRAITRLTRAAGLTPGQPKILHYLTTHDGCTQKEIGDGCALDKSTVTGLIGRMVSDGLVTREPRENNRRELQVRLTPRGSELARTAVENAARVDRIALRGLSPAERDALSDLLARVIDNLRQHGSEA